MQRIFLDEAKPSMVLAVRVKDKRNDVLFLKGTKLTEKHIQTMKGNDVLKVVVEGSPVQRQGGEAAKAVQRRFLSAGDTPLALKIRDILKDLLE